MKAKRVIRSFLMLFAFSGIILSLFWDSLMSGTEGVSSNGGLAEHGVCPFAKSPLAKALYSLPDINEKGESQTANVMVDNLCEDCILVQDRIFRAGPIRDMFRKGHITLDELASMLGGHREVSEHSKDAALQLIRKKLVFVGKLNPA